MSKMVKSVLQRGLDEILCCPDCKGDLRIQAKELLECTGCKALYPVEDGIPMLVGRSGSSDEQARERAFREAVAREHGAVDCERILKVVSRHHCLPVMEQRARSFRASIRPSEWIMDVGCGTGYYWRGTVGGSLLLLDFAIDNLRAAQPLLQDSGEVLPVQAGAHALPVRQASIDAVWSVQATQHFPDPTMSAFLQELKRVLKERFRLEIYNLHPSWLYRSIYRLCGKSLHVRGERDGMVLNRLDKDELASLWTEVAGERRMRIGYSELFFHPDFHLRSQSRAIERMESLFCALPWLASRVARQVHVEIASQE